MQIARTHFLPAVHFTPREPQLLPSNRTSIQAPPQKS